MPWAEKDMSIVLKEADAARLSLPLCGSVKEVIKGIKSLKYSFIVVNFANADMVGHTAKPEAVIKAVETLRFLYF